MDVDSWYFSNRGITSDTLDKCGITRGKDYASWKVGGATKIRENFGGEGRDRKMYYKAGETPRKVIWWTHECLGFPKVITEGETDGMRLAQEAQREFAVGALSGVHFFDSETFKELNGDGPVYFVFDNDGDGGEYENQATKAVNLSWQRIRKLVPNAKRIYLPNGYKDVCAYLDVYSIEDFKKLMVEAEVPKFMYEALDLTKAAEPPNWLWDTKMARGDIVIFQSEPNMGKSFVSTGLAVSVVEGHGSFLGFSTVSGKVLIIDEENPEDVIRNRLAGLGLSSRGLANLRIVHEQGVRLDKDPERLRQEAEAFKPDLIILDSLTRLHTEEEKDAGAISRLFNEGVHPLARKLGATVLVLHHTGKTLSSSSFTRTRGSSDINAVADACYDFVEHEFRDGPSKMMLNYKNRRGPRGSKVFFKIEDTEPGVIEIKRQTTESAVL